uniref:OBP27 n=1 Tax=Eupeodes corollae TaxID=290404 RepID=A0A8F9WM61_9MUSC|nr:OBP27 [Eupeodes corollae]
MKFFLAIAFVTIVVAVNAANINIPDAHKEKVMQIVAECQKEMDISAETLAKIKAGEPFGADEKTKCFANCFQEKAGILKDGVFQEEAIVAKFSESFGADKTKSIVDACRGEATGKDNCEKAYNLHACFKKNNAY